MATDLLPLLHRKFALVVSHKVVQRNDNVSGLDLAWLFLRGPSLLRLGGLFQSRALLLACHTLLLRLMQVVLKLLILSRCPFGGLAPRQSVTVRISTIMSCGVTGSRYRPRP